jgi:hypothetical protein
MAKTVFIIFILAYAESNAMSCSQSKYCTPTGWCENFTSLIELNSALLDDSSCPGYFEMAEDYSNDSISIYIKANDYKGPINDRFDCQTFVQTTFPNKSFSLYFFGFDGIDLNFTCTSSLYGFNDTSLELAFTFAKFDFYLNGKPWDASTCNDTELASIFDKERYGIFGVLASLYITFEFQSSYSNFKKWCPWVFKNAQIDDFRTIAKPIRFYPGNHYYNFSSGIRSASFANLAADNLDKEILHPQVYSLLDHIIITGCVKKIETDVFKEMKNLQFMELSVYNLKGFIHGNGIEWMNYVNYYTSRLNTSRFELSCADKCLKLLNSFVFWIQLDITGDSNSSSLLYYPNMIPHAFPDEDFCLFSNYPHDRSVFIVLKNGQKCTCTIVWMLKNPAFLAAFTKQNALFNTFYLQNHPCTSLIYNFTQFKLAFNACGFPEKYLKCQLNVANLNQSTSSYTDSYFQFYDTQQILIEMRDILENYFDYWVLVLGFLANVITMIVIINAYRKASLYSNIKNNQLGSIKENFFTYMLINSLNNSIYCLIMFFNETLPCVAYPAGEMYSENNCHITDACIATTASVLKLTANVTYLQMSLNRYLLVGKDHSEWLKKAGKANIVIVGIIALTTSCLLSYVVVEQENFFNYLRVQCSPMVWALTTTIFLRSGIMF